MRKTITTERGVGMRKKGIVLLLVLGVLLLVGCDNEAGNTIEPFDFSGLASEWGEGTSKAPYISFLLDADSSKLEGIDISMPNDDDPKTYTVDDLSTKGNTITGTYIDFEDPENPEYDITLTLSYSAPKLTVKITGKGPLANKTYIVEPASEDGDA
ncbi:MAG TPA: hypothetical protein PLT42_00895 [Sphaerochaeta sp.]|nr:hypothetical protein [Sphaerochaeta sp.]HPK46362.1 hypothetical protein [Sphaerochaeta sp.]